MSAIEPDVFIRCFDWHAEVEAGEFDWFAGFASSARALKGPRAGLYQGKTFDDFRFALFEHEPDRPERLEHAAFAAPEPEEMLIDEVESIWADIDRDDDWSAFRTKLARLEVTRQARL